MVITTGESNKVTIETTKKETCKYIEENSVQTSQNPYVERITETITQPGTEFVTEIETEMPTEEVTIQQITPEPTFEWCVNYENNGGEWADIDEVDFLYMCRCVETETYQNTFEGKINVASTIINRANYNNTSIYNVVTAPHQFAYGRKKIAEETRLACLYVLTFGVSHDCYYFHSFESPIEFYGTYQFTDNMGHHYYKK